MPHTTNWDIEKAAIEYLHNDDVWWCEAELDWRWADSGDCHADGQRRCFGCKETLSHPNHRWSRERMEKDREAD